MSQADGIVENNLFPAVRAEINTNLAALFSNNSGDTQPSVSVPFQTWVHTSSTADPILKIRNNAGSFATIGTITGSTFVVAGTLPSQSGNSGKFLTTNGTVASFAALPITLDYQEFLTSGTWTKPLTAKLVYVEVWGAGGSGARTSSGCGGGGGAYRFAFIKADTLAGSIAVTIGAGGVARTTTNQNGADGGSSTFGNIFAGGGGGGQSTEGGGGGGWRGSAALSAPGTGYMEFGTGSSLGYGVPQFVGAVGGSAGGNGGDNVYGGSGGGGRNSNTVRAGGTSVFGGAGGAGGGAGVGTAGSQPGGGGGASASTSGAGGAGLIRVYTW